MHATARSSYRAPELSSILSAYLASAGSGDTAPAVNHGGAMKPTAILPLADRLFALMGIAEPLPRVECVARPRGLDLSAYTETELRWMSEAQEAQEAQELEQQETTGEIV